MDCWTTASDLLQQHGLNSKRQVGSLLRRWRKFTFLQEHGNKTVGVRKCMHWIGSVGIVQWRVKQILWSVLDYRLDFVDAIVGMS